MRTATRLGVVLALVTPTLGLLATSAQAATGAPPVVSTAWFWNEKSISEQGQTLPTLPDQADATSGVPAGALGVGYTNDLVGDADKAAAIGFDLTSIPVMSTITQFQVTVPLASGAQVHVNPAAISACENIDVFTDSPTSQPIAKAPPVSGPSCVPGKLISGKAYVFDLTAMANDWSLGAPSLGISLRPTLLAATDMTPFSIALAGKNAITTKASWTTPTAITTPAPGPVVTTDPLPAQAPLPPIAGGGTVLAPPLTPVDVPQPQTAVTQPVPQINPQPVTPVAFRAVALPRTLRPDNGWWLGLLGIAVLLALGYVVQSDPMAPAPVDGRRARFARVVRSGTPTS